MVWRFFKYFFQLFRCSNLALNRCLSYSRAKHVGVVSIGLSTCPLYVCTPLYIHMPLDTPVHLYVPPISYVPNMSWGLGGICTIHKSWGLGGHQYISQAFLCLFVHPFASQFITAIPVAPPSLWVASYWTGYLGCLICFMLFLSLCSAFIMSQASTTMTMTTTPPVTVVSSGTSSLLSKVTMAPSLMGLPVTSDQHDMVLLPLLTPGHSRSVVCLAAVP